MIIPIFIPTGRYDDEPLDPPPLWFGPAILLMVLLFVAFLWWRSGLLTDIKERIWGESRELIGGDVK